MSEKKQAIRDLAAEVSELSVHTKQEALKNIAADKDRSQGLLVQVQFFFAEYLRIEAKKLEIQAMSDE